MNASLRDLFLSALSTRLIIFDTVLSPKHRVVRISSTPVRFTHPDATVSPTVTSRGALSPVRATVLRADEPFVTTPSSATFAPGATTMVSPTFTSSGATVSTFSPRFTSAVSGRMAMRCEMLRLLLPSA